MNRLMSSVAEFVTNPLNLLIFIFLWVGVALVGTDAGVTVSMEILLMMAIPAALGYLIGRGK